MSLPKYRVESRGAHYSGIHSNYFYQVVGPEGVVARFGKPVPAINVAARQRNARIEADRYCEELNRKEPT